MHIIKNFDITKIEPHRIAVVLTKADGYEERRIILVETELQNEFILASAYHCSCYDFDDAKWDATLYWREELIKVFASWQTYVEDLEFQFANIALKYLSE